MLCFNDFRRNLLCRGYGGQEGRKDRKGVGASRPLPHRLSFVVRRPSSRVLHISTALLLAWRTGETGEQLLFSPASPALPAEFYIGFAMVFAAKNAKVLGWGEG